MDFGLQEATVSRIFTGYEKICEFRSVWYASRRISSPSMRWLPCAPADHIQMTTARLRKTTERRMQLCSEKPQTDECSSAPEKDNDFSSVSKEDRNYYRSAPKDERCMIAALFRNKTDYYSISPKYYRKITTALFQGETEITTGLLRKTTDLWLKLCSEKKTEY